MVARTRYVPDRGLTARMGATMFLLGLVFVAFVAAIIYILSAVGASSGVIVLFAFVIGGGMAIGSLFYSDKIAHATAGAYEVSPQQAPELHGVVDRICALADMPKPRVAIAQQAPVGGDRIGGALDRRYASLMERALAIHPDVALWLRVPGPVGAR